MPKPGGIKGKAQTSVLQGNKSAWQPCILTWYDPALGGTNSASGARDPHSRTASGEPYDANALTCAAPPSYAFGTTLTFRFGAKQVTVRVNDRGGAIQGNHFDLSRGAADQLGVLSAGRATATFMVGTASGAPPAANATTQAANAAAASSSPKVGSVLDLLTAPIDTIGGWLAGIALNVVKDVGEGVVDYMLRPAWHWNQRAVMQYQEDMFNDKSGKQLLWTAAFWGGGYWLLFTDPNAKDLKPAPVRNSRLARHARFAQSLPARNSLIKPKDVKGKTPKKPEPVTSRAVVVATGTMSTTRTHTVKVTGTHARADNGSQSGQGTESAERVERTGSLPTQNRNHTRNKPTVPNPEHRAGDSSLQNRGGNSEGGTGPRRTSGDKP